MAVSATRAATELKLLEDVGSFYSAVTPHVEKMRRVSARLVGIDGADDVVQDALLQAWKARAQFDPSRGTLAAWLLAITAHQAAKVSRGLRRIVVSRATPAAVGVEDGIDIHDAVRKLPQRERLAVDCFYFADLSIAETAAVMGCAEGTVKWTLSSARKHLRGALK